MTWRKELACLVLINIIKEKAMNKVVNSVQQIIAECNEMLSKLDGCEYIDVKSLASTLKELFNEHPEQELEISQLKADVEATAIRLEFYMSVHLGLYTDRRKLRKYAEKIYEDCRQISLELTKKDVSNETIIDWGMRTRWALGFYGASTHIIFYADESDDKEIHEIVDAMKAYKEEANG
jgi:hypothetical protein